ncbi:Transcription factor lepE [Paramyrothecium foliicola]|nr:Transcription factor lepE [Paramyrothecium foliicola]
MAAHNTAVPVPEPSTASPGTMLASTNAPDAPLPHQTSPHHYRQHTPTFGQTPQQQQQPPQQQPPPTQQQQSQLLQQPHARSVKRPRPVKSCTECRKRKLRCDRLCPCSQCQKSGRMCRYAAEHESSNLSDASDGEGIEPNRQPKRHCGSGSSAAPGAQPTETSCVPTVRNGEQPSVHLYEELSLRMERLEKQIQSRSPAGTEFSSSKTLCAPPDTIRGMSVKRGAQRTRFFGQNNPRILMNLFDEAKDFMAAQHTVGEAKEVLSGFHKLHRTLQDEYRKSLAPITVFVDSMMPVHKRMTDILPKKAVCDRLVSCYIDTSETIYRTLHLPTFSEQYELYWEGKLQSESFVPQLLSVLSIASRFETKSKGLGPERSEGVHIPTACALIRTWLDGLKGKQLVEITTLQVEILLLHAQRMITPRADETWTQLGFIVRLAMTMGLHRDPSEFEPRMTVFVGEIRRRLWFTILDMDLHTSLQSSLPCLLRDGDFSCRPPRNLDDSELYPDMRELPPTKPIDQPTDNQMQVYAAMTLGVRMKVSQLVHRIDTVRDYHEILDIGAKLDRFLEDINYICPRHGIMNDNQKSKLWRSRVILDMHVRRPLLALYRPFALGSTDAPAQISRAYLRSSMVIMKYLDELDPLLAHFQDITDMYHQILKRDIMQAAFSVCYYIRLAVQPNSDSVHSQQALRMSPDSTDDYPSYTPENLMLWSPARLITTVEKTLDLLVRNVGGADTKAVVSLAIVLETVRTADPKTSEIVQGLRTVLDACLRASDLTYEKIGAVTHSTAPNDAFPTDPYMHGRLPMMYPHANNAMGLPASLGDLGGWMVWQGWD